MKLPVVIRPRAEQQLEDAAGWWSENRSTEQAIRWYEGFVKAIESLAVQPDRCPLALESREFPFEVRELHYGLGPKPTHRALFTIRPNMVYVFLIRHVAQQDITLDDF